MMYLHRDGQWRDVPEYEGQVPAPMNPLLKPLSTKPDQEHILEDIIPQVIDHVQVGFLHYGDTYKKLGLPGQFADIWRKIGPLERQLWDGVPSTRENPRTICMDLIGHCLLTIAMLDRGVEIGSSRG